MPTCALQPLSLLMIPTLTPPSLIHRVCVHVFPSCPCVANFLLCTHIGTSKSRSSLDMRSPASDADVSRLVDVVPPWGDRSSAGFSPPASLLKTIAAASRRENANVATGKENARIGAAVPAGKEKANVNVRRESVHGHQRTQSGKAAPAPSRLPALVQPLKCAYPSSFLFCCRTDISGIHKQTEPGRHRVSMRVRRRPRLSLRRAPDLLHPASWQMTQPPALRRHRSLPLVAATGAGTPQLSPPARL